MISTTPSRDASTPYPTRCASSSRTTTSRGGRELRFQTTVGEQKRADVAINASTAREESIAFRERRDAQLAAPKLLFHSVQVKIDAGRLPPPQGETSYLKIPLNVFKPKARHAVEPLDTGEAPQITGGLGQSPCPPRPLGSVPGPLRPERTAVVAARGVTRRRAGLLSADALASSWDSLVFSVDMPRWLRLRAPAGPGPGALAARGRG